MNKDEMQNHAQRFWDSLEKYVHDPVLRAPLHEIAEQYNWDWDHTGGGCTNWGRHGDGKGDGLWYSLVVTAEDGELGDVHTKKWDCGFYGFEWQEWLNWSVEGSLEDAIKSCEAMLAECVSTQMVVNMTKFREKFGAPTCVQYDLDKAYFCAVSGEELAVFDRPEEKSE